MKLTKIQIISELYNLIARGNKILETKWSPIDNSGGGVVFLDLKFYVNSDMYVAWNTKIIDFVSIFLPKDSHYLKTLLHIKKNSYTNAKTTIQLLNDMVEQIEKDQIFLAEHEKSIDISNCLDRIFTRFHNVARQLRTRHAKRETLSIADEYDVQDLLHALLRLYFDDIRPEEWTPSYAGGCSRMDFLLKNEKVVIEVKKTRNSMKDSDLGKQLIIDIEKYKTHPDCEHLICFVYDPEGLLGNPTGIENDLNSKYGGFEEVIISPK